MRWSKKNKSHCRPLDFPGYSLPSASVVVCSYCTGFGCSSAVAEIGATGSPGCRKAWTVANVVGLGPAVAVVVAAVGVAS